MAEEEVSLSTLIESPPTQVIKPDRRPNLLSRITHGRLGRIGSRLAAATGLATLGIFGMAENAQAPNMIDPYGITPNDKLQSTDYIAPPAPTTLEGNNIIISPSPVPENPKALTQNLEPPKTPTAPAQLRPATTPIAVDPGLNQIGGAIQNLEAKPIYTSNFAITYEQGSGTFTVVINKDNPKSMDLLNQFLASKGIPGLSSFGTVGVKYKLVQQ